MKNLLRFLAFVLMVGGAYAQSNLPACPTTGYFNNCFGTFVFPSGERYVGEFRDNLRHGQGAFFTSSGLVVSEGLWSDGKFVRRLSVQQAISQTAQPSSAERDRFNAEIEVERKKRQELEQQLAAAKERDRISSLPACPSSGYFHNCFTSYTFPNGWKYVGDWKENKYNGHGTLFGSNGTVVSQGFWSDGKFVSSASIQQSSLDNQTFNQSKLPTCPTSGYLNNCVGAYTYPNNWKYVGEWKDNRQNGQGTLYAANGSVANQGIWSDGKFVRYVQEFQANSSSVLPSSAERDRFNAEIEAERKKRLELEQQLAAAKERERITAELDLERKKRQELEAQLATSVQPTQPQTNAPRRIAHALVIGNGAYPGSGRLDNPVNDANAISQKLRSMGFTVTTVTDANRQRLVQSMTQFRRTAASADISLLYYAGHGVQIFGTNYILPTDVDQTDPAQATIQGVSLNSVVENFLPGKTKLVFLDACRDNALQRTSDRSVSKGLAPISAAEGTLISYATKDGQTAADGVGSKNSPFTQALLEHLNDPQDIAVVLRKVRERVMKITGGKQQPWEYGSLTGGELVLSAIRQK
jgi:hypothetical protein